MKPNDVLDGYLNNKEFQRKNGVDFQWYDLDLTSISLDKVKYLCERELIRFKPKPYKKEVIVKFDEGGLVSTCLEPFFPIHEDNLNRTYKVTIEEIEQ